MNIGFRINSSTIIKTLMLVLFSLIVLLFFRFYSLLRPAACGALYKELISGSIVILICFLNYFILYPHLYERRKIVSYILFSFVSAVAAAIGEEVLVYTQISIIIKSINVLSFRGYFVYLTIALSLRNLCFLTVFFIIKLAETKYAENNDINLSLIRNNHLIVAKDVKNKTITIHISDIAYCQQIENYAYLFLTDGRCFTRYCSMRSLADDLGAECAVRISRNLIAMYAHIHSFSQNTVCVHTYEGIKGFEITESFREQALTQLKKHNLHTISTSEKIIDSQNIETITNNHDEQAPTLSDNEVVPEEKQSLQQILHFIQENPNCKGDNITKYSRLSLRTVNRILAQLKADGLIEYVGSKKNGGYRAVEKNDNITNM